MKNLLFAILFLVTGTISAQQTAIIPEGTLIEAELTKDINGRDLNVGDIIEFKLFESIYVNDKKVIPFGQKIIGTVTEAKGSRMLGKKGKLEFTIDYMYLDDGTVIKLSGAQKSNLQGSGVAVAATSVVLTPFALLINGRNAKYEKGKLFKCFIAQNLEVIFPE